MPKTISLLLKRFWEHSGSNGDFLLLQWRFVNDEFCISQIWQFDYWLHQRLNKKGWPAAIDPYLRKFFSKLRIVWQGDAFVLSLTRSTQSFHNWTMIFNVKRNVFRAFLRVYWLIDWCKVLNDVSKLWIIWVILLWKTNGLYIYFANSYETINDSKSISI